MYLVKCHVGVPFQKPSIGAINRQPRDDYGIGNVSKQIKPPNKIVRRISFEFYCSISQQKILFVAPISFET